MKAHVNRKHLHILGVLCFIIILGQVYMEYASAGLAGPNRVIREEFKVSLVLSYEIPDIYSWQAVITFNPNVVLVLNVQSSGFLSSNSIILNSSNMDLEELQQIGEGDSIFLVSYNDIEVGKLFLAETKIGNTSGTTGSGVLATITFGVFGQGSYDIQLLETLLFDSKGNPIRQASLIGPTKIS